MTGQVLSLRCKLRSKEQLTTHVISESIIPLRKRRNNSDINLDGVALLSRSSASSSS